MLTTELLGLPTAEVVGVTNPVLGSEYREFADALQAVADERVVIVSPYQLSVPTEGITDSATEWFSNLTEQQRAKLLLLSIISKPFDPTCLWPEGQPRFADKELVAVLFPNLNPQSLAEHRPAVPYGLDTIAGQRVLRSEPALHGFAQALPRSEPIETISSEFIGAAPGNYGYQMWQVCRWSDDWAVVFGVTDASRDEGYPFPWLLGFCRRDHLERNFVELLREGSRHFDVGFYNTYGTVNTHWPLARIALVTDESREEADWEIVDWVLALGDDRLLTFLGNETDRDSDFEIVERLRRAREAAEMLGLEDLALTDLLARAGTDRSLDALESHLSGLESEQDERDRVALEERNRKIARFSDSIAAVLASIQDLPPDMRFPTAAQAEWRNDARRRIVRQFIEDHIAEHDTMPRGAHDFGLVNVRSGLTRISPVQVGVIDLDVR